MSGTPRAGRNARCRIDDTAGATNVPATITSKTKWTLDQTMETFEVTAFEDTGRTYVAGLPDGKGTLEGFWDSGDNNIYNLIGSSVGRSLYLYPDVVNNAGTYFFCTAFFSVKSGGEIKNAVDFSLNFVAATPVQWVHP